MADAEDRPMEPTEGTEPPTAGAEPPPDATPTTDAEPGGRTVSDASAGSDDGAPSRDEMSIAFTPAQLAVGGAVVAGLVAVGIRLLLGRRRDRG